MFTIRQSEPDDLTMETDRILFHMQATNPSSEEYAAMNDQFVRLSEIKAANAKKTISPDTWAIIAANLLGIGLVLHYERAAVVTSKATGFLLKLK